MNVIPTTFGHAKHCCSDFVSPLYIITAAYQIYWKLDTIHATSFFITILRPYLPCCARVIRGWTINKSHCSQAGDRCWMDGGCWMDGALIRCPIVSLTKCLVISCQMLQPAHCWTTYLIICLNAAEFTQTWRSLLEIDGMEPSWNERWRVPTDNLVAIASTHWMLYQYDCSQVRCYC